MNKVTLLFPGQGSQFVGMGKDICDNFKKGNKIFQEANDILGFNLQKMCFEGGIEELTKTVNAQPAILTVSYITYQLFLENFHIEPDFMAGHSLGEYSALLCSKAISFEDALRIVKKRGEFMQEAAKEGTGAMIAVRNLDNALIENICNEVSTSDEVVVISNYNAPLQTVISGHKNAIEKAYAKLEKTNGQLTKLNVSAPFHSPLMDQASKKLRNELMKYKYNELEYPVISNVDGKPYENSRKIISNLTHQLIQPVQWVKSMQYIEQQKVNIAVELGPKYVLRNLMKVNSNKIKSYSLNIKEDMKLLKEDLGQSEEKNSEKFSKLIGRCLAMAVCTKNNNWDNDEYNNGVIKPYQKIQQKLEKDNNLLTIDDMRESLKLLKVIFDTKKVSIEEQKERINQILTETGTNEVLKEIIIEF